MTRNRMNILGISAYFIHDFENFTHLRYWVAIVRRLHPIVA